MQTISPIEASFAGDSRISEVILKGTIWVSKGRRVRVQVVNLARHGEDCASRFVLYTNLEPTEDFAPGERWILGLEAFRARFDPFIRPAV